MAKRQAPYCRTDANPAHDFANCRISGDQIDRCLNFRPQPVAQPGALTVIPSNVVTKLRLGFGSWPDRLRHLPKSSRSIRARTSFQSEVDSVPASTAAHLFSISA